MDTGFSQHIDQWEAIVYSIVKNAPTFVSKPFVCNFSICANKCTKILVRPTLVVNVFLEAGYQPIAQNDEGPLIIFLFL